MYHRTVNEWLRCRSPSKLHANYAECAAVVGDLYPSAVANQQQRVSGRKKKQPPPPQMLWKSLLWGRQSLAALKPFTIFLFPEQCSCSGGRPAKLGCSPSKQTAMGIWSYRRKQAVNGVCTVTQAARDRRRLAAVV